jgi:hypothetical protein
MTSEQISALNTMVLCNPKNSCFEVMYAGGLVVLSVLKSYDPITNRGHWSLSYGSYISDLYSHREISPYDKGVLRYMYNEYMTYYNKLLSNNRAI